MYSNNDYGGGLSDYYKRLSATKAKFYLSNGVLLDANILIDTGSNADFVLMTANNVDSLLKSLNKPYAVINKRHSLGDEVTDEDKFKSDSITVDSQILKKGMTIFLTKADEITNLIFGRVQTFGLLGVPFLKQCKRFFF